MRYLVLLILAVSFTPVGWTQADRIKPGDQLKVTVEGDESLSRVYTVDNQGNVQMPLIGLVKVMGLTTDEAAQTIARLLKEGKFFRDPVVRVEWAQKATPTVSVGGAVGRSGTLTLQQGWRLADALKVAEPTTQADLSAVRIERADGSLLTVNFNRFQQENDPTSNPELQPGDRIFVPLRPAGNDVMVLGAVRTAGIVPFEAGLTVSTAIQKAGGALPDADLSQIRLKRKGSADPVVVNLTTPGADPTLNAGDQITVPFRPVKVFILVRGAVHNPGLVNYTENMTLTRAIEAAGGPTSEARLERVTIERPEGKRKRIITVNLLEVAQGRRADEIIQPGDSINVPYPPRRTSAAETLQIVWLVLSIAFLLARR